MKAEWIDNGPTMWAEMGLQSGKTESVNSNQSFARSQKSCVGWPVPACHVHAHVCVCRSTHMHAIFNACTSHIHRRLCCSFISPLYPPPPLMWDTLESEEYSPGERNGVDMHSPLLRKRLAIDPPCVSWSLLSLCLLRSITRSITSPASPTSICAPTAIHYSRIFSSV